MKITEEKLKQIEEYTNTAISIFSFLQNIPSPLGEFIFKRIVEDAYSIADVMGIDVTRKQLIESICSSIETSKNLDLVYKYLDVMDYREKIDTIVMEKDKLYDFLISSSRFKELPDESSLIKAFTCFSPNSVDDEYKENLKVCVRAKILSLDEVKDNGSDLYSNIFQELGYKTLFINWSYGDLPEHDELFFKWYCKGTILNVVIDTVFKCDVNIISKSLMQHIKRECKSNYYLSKAFQNIYNSYRRYTSLPEMSFECISTIEVDNSMMFSALPRIQDSGRDISDECLYKLYQLLTCHGDIQCPFEAFKAVFSGRASFAEPIQWFRSAKILAAFLCIVRGDQSANKEYSNWAAKLFIQKNGKPSSSITLNQPDFDAIKEYKEIFNNAGIKR